MSAQDGNLALMECKLCRECVDEKREMHTGPLIQRIFNSQLRSMCFIVYDSAASGLLPVFLWPISQYTFTFLNSQKNVFNEYLVT